MELIQEFESDFNAIEHLLRTALRIDNYVPFTQLVRSYAEEHAQWSDADFLRRIARIRNVIVHEKREPYCHLVIPAPAIVEELRQCKERLLNPLRAIPKFQRLIETISMHDSLHRVLNIIHQRDYSQFPVYECTNFRGLLTENGITRWLAGHIATGISSVELDHIAVRQVLESEEERQNHQFVSREMRVDAVVTLFARHALLEAVLVTTTGNETEDLLGIATRWDILHLTSST